MRPDGRYLSRVGCLVKILLGGPVLGRKIGGWRGFRSSVSVVFIIIVLWIVGRLGVRLGVSLSRIRPEISYQLRFFIFTCIFGHFLFEISDYKSKDSDL